MVAPAIQFHQRINPRLDQYWLFNNLAVFTNSRGTAQSQKSPKPQNETKRIAETEVIDFYLPCRTDGRDESHVRTQSSSDF
jgi:hypothetical protein